MNQTEQYRRISAEKLGLKQEYVKNWPSTASPYVDKEGNPWFPDQDANQQNMIEDWIEDDIYIYREGDMWFVDILNSDCDEWNGKHKSKSTAFMQAFLEYCETLNQTQ